MDIIWMPLVWACYALSPISALVCTVMLWSVIDRAKRGRSGH